MIKISTAIFIISIFLGGCFSSNVTEEKLPELGQMKINYYANKSVTSLEIPPDLTSPETQNSFILSELVPDIKESVISFSDTKDAGVKKILSNPVGIKVKKNDHQRWLEIDNTPENVWTLAREFLKLEGFILEKENKKIGIIETDYLENRPDIPDQSLGFIRSALGRAFNQKYTFAKLDKYRIRIEPIDKGERSELYLSLSSIQETVNEGLVKDPNKESAVFWKPVEKDISLETEMLYRLMVYLGGEDVKNKIIETKSEQKVIASLQDGINGYAKLVFDLNLLETWKQISWSIDQNNLDVEDKDILEKAFYIRTARTADQGIISKILGDEAIKLTYRITLKEIEENKTEVYFSDVAEENEKETKEYSYDFFKMILSKF